MQKRKVIIVGGGLAGLSAAYELSREAGFEVHLIEKATRLGGRVLTYTINGQGADVGGFLVYPWYKRYHQLVDDLGLSDELIKVPAIRDYFVNDRNKGDEYHDEVALSFKEMVGIFVKIFPKVLTDRDPTDPELEAYDHLTVKDYLKTLGAEPKRVAYYTSVFDTYLQGYCYGSVTEHKMAFMASTLFQNMIHGDVHSASYLRCGSQVFIDALTEELRSRGVQMHLNCELKKVTGKQLTTSQGDMSADHFIFCQPPAEVAYSNFITATVKYSGVTQIEDDPDWGSCFFREDPELAFPILSVVNLEKLYGKEVAQHLNLNIKVNHPDRAAVSDAALLDIIREQLPERFEGITNVELVNRVDWKQAMPIAQEEYVATKLTEQGANSYYYAGDLMGCPAMETALRTGERAAEKLISDVK